MTRRIPLDQASRDEAKVEEADWLLLDGQAASPHRALLDLGGVGLRVRGEPDVAFDHLLAEWHAFRSGMEAGRAVDLAVRVVDRLPLHSPRGYPSTAVRDGQILIKMRGMAVVIDPARRTASALLERGSLTQDWSNLLRMVLIAAAPGQGRFLIHAAAVELPPEGGVALVFGPPHCGKSTAARLAAPRRVLTDDAVLLSFAGDHLMAATAGFWGGEGSEGLEKRREPQVLRVLALITPRKAESNAVAAVPRGRGALLVSCSLLVAPGLAEPRRQALELADRAVRSVPVLELHFSHQDGSFWALVERHIGCATPSPRPIIPG